VRGDVEKPGAFLENELNLDSFKEYLTWSFPGRALEAYDGQARFVLDALVAAGYKTLHDVDSMVKNTAAARDAITKELEVGRAEDGTVPSNLEPAVALALSEPHGEKLLPWGPYHEAIIRKYRTNQKGAG
jgi:hypothetical protein